MENKGNRCRLRSIQQMPATGGCCWRNP